MMQCTCVRPTGTYHTGIGPQYTECLNRAEYLVGTWQGYSFKCCKECYEKLFPETNDTRYAKYIGY